MRMWGVNPRWLCDKHLLGEHGEMHKFLPTFHKRLKVSGRFSPIVQIQFKGYVERHEALAKEMLCRSMNHRSPLVDVPDFELIYPDYYHLEIDTNYSVLDLKSRCSLCKEIIEWETSHARSEQLRQSE